ncbi:hypothetical protein LMG23992_01396 [Cupriavidus laharis]|uniref:Uncharacterized protein n=1 Tax=Cupriavidus laharis TaxID=151654 RepID=A0ABM8WNX0_9BURK|nr:hypothetical protein LMG23992_01396 [Cupriavidus laharis]
MNIAKAPKKLVAVAVMAMILSAFLGDSGQQLVLQGG